MLSEMGGDAIAALCEAAGEATFDRTVDMATVMMTEPDLRDRLRARIEAEVTADTRVLVAHSLGTVLSYAALAAHDDWPVHTFVTLGSPLAAPMVFNSLEPAPVDGQGVWPGSVQRWVNVRAVGDKAAALSSPRSSARGSRRSSSTTGTGRTRPSPTSTPRRPARRSPPPWRSTGRRRRTHRPPARTPRRPGPFSQLDGRTPRSQTSTRPASALPHAAGAAAHQCGVCPVQR